MVRLASNIAQHITGHVHIQTNPYYSYSVEKTIVNALSNTPDLPTKPLIDTVQESSNSSNTSSLDSINPESVSRYLVPGKE